MSRRRRTREPVEPFRPTWGFLWLVGDTLVLLFDYSDIADLTHDWLRTTRERGYFPGVVETPTVDIATTASGRPWADYGCREYRGRNGTEPVTRRIAVPLKLGGLKWDGTDRRLADACSFLVVFAHTSPEDSPAWVQLLGGEIPEPCIGTTTVSLPGLVVHDRFLPVGRSARRKKSIGIARTFAENLP
jgi:hypothetical protein